MGARTATFTSPQRSVAPPNRPPCAAIRPVLHRFPAGRGGRCGYRGDRAVWAVLPSVVVAESVVLVPVQEAEPVVSGHRDRLVRALPP